MPKEFISAWTGIPKAKHYGASAPELTLQLSLDCDPQQAEALAQFVKRVTWGAMRAIVRWMTRSVTSSVHQSLRLAGR
jgi:hypothetical protein